MYETSKKQQETKILWTEEVKWTGKGKKRAYKKVQRRVVKAKNNTEKKQV